MYIFEYKKQRFSTTCFNLSKVIFRLEVYNLKITYIKDILLWLQVNKVVNYVNCKIINT